MGTGNATKNDNDSDNCHLTIEFDNIVFNMRRTRIVGYNALHMRCSLTAQGHTMFSESTLVL